MSDNQIETVVEKLIPGGDALARVDGMAHFIPGALPGERVRARVLQRKKGWARTDVPEILEASAHRREPFCPLYGECGGCSWQHIDDDFQLQAKVGFFREALVRQGGMSPDALPEIPAFPSPPRGYRARIRPKMVSGGKAAFRAAGSDRAVAVSSCPVATDAVNRFLADPPAEINVGSEPIVFGGDGEPFVQGLQNEAFVTVKGREFRFPPGAFFQSNLSILEVLVDFATGNTGGGEIAMDLYGGVGLFGAFLADSFTRVIGVDRDKRAASPWKRHVGASGRFYTMSLEDWVKRRDTDRPDFIIVDPPRGGLDASVRQGLIKLGSPEISYVSCDPVTQARDLKELFAAGYHLESCGVFDMYPQTPHVETVVRLKRGSNT